MFIVCVLAEFVQYETPIDEKIYTYCSQKAKIKLFATNLSSKRDDQRLMDVLYAKCVKNMCHSVKKTRLEVCIPQHNRTTYGFGFSLQLAQF